MMTQKDILKMVKHISKRSQNIPDRRLLHPKREWFIGVVGFLIVLTIGGVVSAQRFLHYNSIDAEIQASDVRVISYKEGTMMEVLNFFNNRSEMFLSLREGIEPELTVPVIDVATSTATSTEVQVLQESTETTATSSASSTAISE